MTTATVPTSPTTEEAPFMAVNFASHLRDWTPEMRSRAAKQGWRTRKSAYLQSWRRFNDLLATADPQLVRRYHCDFAEEVFLPICTEHLPGDPRPATALWVARRYAEGQATEMERLGAAGMIIALESNLPQGMNRHGHVVYRAMQALGWSLYKNARHALRNAMCWMPEEEQARIRDGGLAAALKATE